jgi:hypothetical protein
VAENMNLKERRKIVMDRSRTNSVSEQQATNENASPKNGMALGIDATWTKKNSSSEALLSSSGKLLAVAL